jgi:dTDP-4-dehydrorhamnose reductase
MSTVIVFGASGLLGASLVPALRLLGYNVLTQSRSDGADLRLDLYNRTAVMDVLIQYHPAVVLNLVAETNVDQCEINPQLAWKANAGVVEILTECIAAFVQRLGNPPHLVHLSTDQVYNGLGPHTEKDVNLTNVYGMSKYAGEIFAQRVDSTVLRTNFYGRSRRPSRVSFTDWLVRSLREKTPITVFDDVKFSAVHIDTLTKIIAQCIERRPVGVFNAGCRDSISKAGFAFALAKALNLATDQVTVGTSADLALKARRPTDMSLQVSRLENVIELQFPTIAGEIEHTAKEYLND